MDAEIVLGILAVVVIAFSLTGLIGWKGILRKYEGVISVGTVLATAFGLASTVMGIGGIVSAITDEARPIETILAFLIAAICIFIVVLAMLRCDTVAQRIMLPFACFSLAMGFGFRLALHFFVGIGMSVGESSNTGGFPGNFVGRDGRHYSLISEYGWAADYDVDGQTVRVTKADIENGQVINYVCDD